MTSSLYEVSKRAFDVAFAGAGLAASSGLLLAIAVTVRVTSPGPAIHWSKRIGRNNVVFLMPKFRTMRIDTPQLPTHLMSQAGRYVTRVGSLLRRSSLDELPQLYSILVGDMTLVGPRPALFNQDDLVKLRTDRGIHHLKPGLTGWAQVNGRDELPIPVKVEYDEYYLNNRSMALDLKIVARTFLKTLAAEGVNH